MGNSLISLTDVGFTYKTLSGLFSIEKYQALKSINLDVFLGETLGVIGSNGSGKSTLLKVLARIYWPMKVVLYSMQKRYLCCLSHWDLMPACPVLTTQFLVQCF